MLKDRKAYEDRLDEQLAGWGADLEVIMGKARHLGVDGMIQFDRAVEATKKRLGEAGLHLQNLKAAGDDTWDHLKDGTEHIWQEIKALFTNFPEGE